MDGSRLTLEAICSGLRMIQAGYERQDEDFDIVFTVGEYGKGQHRIEVSFCRLLSESVELLKDQQHEIWELQELNEHLEDKLKEREAVEPTLIREGRNKYYNDYVCPRCDNEVAYKQNYCSECGVQFLWEGR